MKFIMIACIAAIILSVFLVDGSSQSMQNLTVNLGFSQFPTEYTCSGLNVSPPIEISGLDNASNVTSAAMILEDRSAPKGTFVHWVIWNLPPVNAIPAGIPTVMNVTTPIRAVQGANGAGKIGYFGPCPPPGKPHSYFLDVYGLDKMLTLEPGSNKSELENAMDGHIVLQGEAMATCGR
jgi:Raf kinase inhibitor-like YbhB/YbcL family protein